MDSTIPENISLPKEFREFDDWDLDREKKHSGKSQWGLNKRLNFATDILMQSFIPQTGIYGSRNILLHEPGFLVAFQRLQKEPNLKLHLFTGNDGVLMYDLRRRLKNKHIDSNIISQNSITDSSQTCNVVDCMAFFIEGGWRKFEDDGFSELVAIWLSGAFSGSKTLVVMIASSESATKRNSSGKMVADEGETCLLMKMLKRSLSNIKLNTSGFKIDTKKSSITAQCLVYDVFTWEIKYCG